MPVLSLPPRTAVRIEWRGSEFTRRVQDSLRTALRYVGEDALAEAQGPDGVNVDTGTLRASIQFKIPRRKAGSQIYSLQFGVFPGEGAAQLAWPGPARNTAKGENPEDYAYWQEVDPARGHSYIRVPMSHAMPNLAFYIHEQYKYLNTGQTPGTSAFNQAQEDVNFGQDVGAQSQQTEQYFTQGGKSR